MLFACNWCLNKFEDFHPVTCFYCGVSSRWVEIEEEE